MPAKTSKKSSKKQHNSFQLQAENLERAKSKVAKVFRVGQSVPLDASTDEILKEANVTINPLDEVEM